MQTKKWICAILLLVVLICLTPESVMASPVEHGILTGRQEAQMTLQLAAADSNVTGPTLAPGNHERWIDRIGQLPDYAATFYSWLETNSESGGALIDPTQTTCIQGESGLYDTYVHRFHTINGSANFTFTGSNHETAAQNAILADLGDAHSVAIKYATAVYGAFDRDHPEVFWLSGSCLYGYDIPYDYTYSTLTGTGTVTYSVGLYFFLKSPDFDLRNPEYRSVQAITTAIGEQNAAVEKILSHCPEDNSYEQVRYLNKTLTEINAYNSAAVQENYDLMPKDAWKGISALTGNTGTEGPVCEGYARALMILCRELGIPCVLAEGQAKSTVNGPSGSHMWNYVQLEGSWYAVDTTWNDPPVSGREDTACTGSETEDWLLVGSNTVLLGMSFDTSHVLTNYTTVNSLSYTNGPVLSAEAYTRPPEIVIPTLTLKAPTLEFKNMICVVAFYTAENTEEVVEMGMITYTEKVDVIDINTAAHVIPGAEFDPATGRYFSSSQGIHAKYLADTVYLACYAKLTDGSYVYTKLAPYSPITYATNQLKNSANTQLKQLVAAMLNYGAEAQLYFGHNVENLANASMTAEQLALPESYRADMVQAVPAASAAKQGIFINNKGFSQRKPAVSFEGAFCINYFFTPAYAPVDGITLYYWNEADYSNADILTADNASGSFKLEGSGTEQYRGEIAGISAKNLSQAVYVTAVYSDGTTTWTSGVLGYSIGAYCGSLATKGGEIAALAEATAVYGYHAKQYFG